MDTLRSAFIKEAAKARLPIAGGPTLSEALQAELPKYLGLSRRARQVKAHSLAQLHISRDRWVAEDVVKMSMDDVVSGQTRFRLRYHIVIRVKTAHGEWPPGFKVESKDGAPIITLPIEGIDAFYEWNLKRELAAFEEQHSAEDPRNVKGSDRAMSGDEASRSRVPRHVNRRDIEILALYQVGGWTLERVGRRFPRNGKPISKQRVSAIVKRVAKRIDLTPRAQLRRGRLPKTHA